MSSVDDATSEVTGGHTDRELVSGSADEVRRNFAVIFDRHIKAVYWQAFSVVADPDDAQEIAQDVFITAWRRHAQVRIVDESLLPWLLVTARLTAQNHRRKSDRYASRIVPIDESRLGHGTDVQQIVDATAVREAIDQAVSQLSKVDRQLFEMCIDGDHSYEEAAQVLGVTHGAVRNRVSRLRGRLRSDLRSVREDA